MSSKKNNLFEEKEKFPSDWDNSSGNINNQLSENYKGNVGIKNRHGIAGIFPDHKIAISAANYLVSVQGGYNYVTLFEAKNKVITCYQWEDVII